MTKSKIQNPNKSLKSKLGKYLILGFGILFVICHLTFVISTTAVAADDYTLDLAGPHGGGAIGLQDSGKTYELWDVKGQPLAGDSTNGGYTVQWGWINYASGSVEVGPIVITEVKDDGLIQGIKIFRATNDPGSNLKLTWIYKSGAGIQFADVWRYVGAAGAPVGDYNSDSTKWKKIFTTLNAGQPEYLDNTSDAPKVGDGNNAYYRVVPKDTIIADIFSYANNARTVAKIDLPLKANGLILASVPVYSGPIDSAMKGQIGNDAINFYPQSGSGLTGYKYANDALQGKAFNVFPGLGLWVENSTANLHNISFVGTLESYSETAIQSLDLTGNSLPYTVTNDKLSAFDDDNLYPQSGSGLTGYKFSKGQWQGKFSLANTAGFWYETGGKRFWVKDLNKGLLIKSK